MWGFLSGNCKRVYISYKRIPIQDVFSSIKQYQEECVSEASGSMRWLHDRFAIKDDLFDSFYKDNQGNAWYCFREKGWVIDCMSSISFLKIT